MRVEDFKLVPTELRLHKCPFKSLPPTVETKEILASLEALRELYPLQLLRGLQGGTPIPQAPSY